MAAQAAARAWLLLRLLLCASLLAQQLQPGA
jgi:hypothetical protein